MSQQVDVNTVLAKMQAKLGEAYAQIAILEARLETVEAAVPSEAEEA